MKTVADLRGIETAIIEEAGDELLLTGIIRVRSTLLPWVIPLGTTWEAPIVNTAGVTVEDLAVAAAGSTISIGLTAAKTAALGPGAWRYWVRPTIDGKPVTWMRGTLTLTNVKVK